MREVSVHTLTTARLIYMRTYVYYNIFILSV